jgi:hypothetical protein
MENSIAVLPSLRRTKRRSNRHPARSRALEFLEDIA